MNEHLRKEPPEYGEIVFEVGRSPVSLQSKSAKKREFKDFVSSIVKGTGFLLSGDVKIIIEWRVTEQHRYEHSSAYDVDNIVKPLLDSISVGQRGFWSTIIKFSLSSATGLILIEIRMRSLLLP